MTEPVLRARVERRLGRAPFVELARAEIVIDGEERAVDGDRWRARIAQHDRGGVLLGEREITSESCDSLLRAATVVVALFIDPDQDEEQHSADDVPAPPREESPRVPPPAPPQPLRSTDLHPRPARAPSTFDLRLGIGASAATGLLPSIHGALLATARLEKLRSPWSFDWTGAFAWPETVAHGPIGGDFAVVQQRARACFALVDQPGTRLEACAGAMGGAILPRTTGVVGASDAWRRLVGPTAALAVDVRAGGKSARLEAGMDVPLGRYVFSYLSNTGERKLFYVTDQVTVFVAITGLGTISP